jgi:hypothetical protein
MYIGMVTSAIAIRAKGERRLTTKFVLRGLVDIPILGLERSSEDLSDPQTILNDQQVGPLRAGACRGARV